MSSAQVSTMPSNTNNEDPVERKADEAFEPDNLSTSNDFQESETVQMYTDGVSGSDSDRGLTTPVDGETIPLTLRRDDVPLGCDLSEPQVYQGSVATVYRMSDFLVWRTPFSHLG